MERRCVIRHGTLTAIQIAHLIFVVVKVELISKRVAVQLRHARATHDREPDAVGHAHSPHTCSIIFSTAFLNFALMAWAGSVVGRIVHLSLLICSNLIKNGLEAAFGNVDSAFEFPSLIFPAVLLLCPEFMDPLRVLLLTSDLLLCGLKSLPSIRY
jgi:hypothetical protein